MRGFQRRKHHHQACKVKQQGVQTRGGARLTRGLRQEATKHVSMKPCQVSGQNASQNGKTIFPTSTYTVRYRCAITSTSRCVSRISPASPPQEPPLGPVLPPAVAPPGQ